MLNAGGLGRPGFKMFDYPIAEGQMIRWTIQVAAVCPKCGKEATLGTLHQSGGCIIKCSACNFMSKHPTVERRAVLAEVLEYAASQERQSSD